MRELRIRELCRDWSQDLAEFYASFPLKDPFQCTIAVFESLLRSARTAVSYVNGHYTEADARADSTERMNREILGRARYPSFFRDPFTTDDYDPDPEPV